MTSDALSHSYSPADDRLWRAIVADLAFWTVVGALAAAVSAPIGGLIDVRPLWFAVGAAGLAAASLALLLGLNRRRPVSRQLVWSFAIGNLAVAPLIWLAASFGWLPLSSFGRWGLAACADAMFLLGVYQLYALRRSASD